MQRPFDDGLERLKEHVLTMAGLVEKSLDEVARAFAGRDAERARAVIAMDDEIDQHEVSIDRLATEVIVRHQPMATDLRFVIVAIKLGPELERIADNAVNIARALLDMDRTRWQGLLPDLSRMLSVARAMVSDAIAAYVARDAARARQVIMRDDEVDRLYWAVFHELLQTMSADANAIGPSISQILVARFAERIADQATNIGEEVVYLVEGRPIRHTDLDGTRARHRAPVRDDGGQHGT